MAPVQGPFGEISRANSRRPFRLRNSGLETDARAGGAFMFLGADKGVRRAPSEGLGGRGVGCMSGATINQRLSGFAIDSLGFRIEFRRNDDVRVVALRSADLP